MASREMPACWQGSFLTEAIKPQYNAAVFLFLELQMLKIKLAFGMASVIFLLTGSRLLFGAWTQIHYLFWIWIVVLAYAFVYRPLTSLRVDRRQVVFTRFNAGFVVTLGIATALATIMFLIFYPHISLLFLWMTFISVLISSSFNFIVFDFIRQVIEGVQGQSPYFKDVTIELSNEKIEVKIVGTNAQLLLAQMNYSYSTWQQLIDNFQKVKTFQNVNKNSERG